MRCIDKKPPVPLVALVEAAQRIVDRRYQRDDFGRYVLQWQPRAASVDIDFLGLRGSAIEADSGEILYNDRGKKLEVSRAEGEELMRFRRRVQYIFQDPFGSLSPRMTVFDILREPLIIHDIGDADYRAEMAKE